MEKRAGVTQKISISLSRDDLAALRKRANRLYAGNVSAVIAELAADAKLLEGMDHLVDWLGGRSLSDEARKRIDQEWRRAGPAKKKRAKPKKAA